ncbi:MAG: hypothetical protein ACP5NU_04330 [Methanomicrobiales archaeon]
MIDRTATTTWEKEKCLLHCDGRCVWPFMASGNFFRVLMATDMAIASLAIVVRATRCRRVA